MTGLIIGLVVIIGIWFFWQSSKASRVDRLKNQMLQDTQEQMQISQAQSSTPADDQLIQEARTFLSDVTGKSVAKSVLDQKIQEVKQEFGEDMVSESVVIRATQEVLYDQKRAVRIDNGWNPDYVLSTIKDAGIIDGFDYSLEDETHDKSKLTYHVKGTIMGQPYEQTVSDALVMDFVETFNPIIEQKTGQKLLPFQEGSTNHVLVPADKYDQLMKSKFTNTY